MIGNDIVDLALAQKESNWKRKGFLDKIFIRNEQLLILNAQNPEIMVWNLWSRKEAAYKIYNRQTKIRGYFPLRIECLDTAISNETIFGKVIISDFVYFTKTAITDQYIYTIAVENIQDFDRIKTLENTKDIEKKGGIPSCLNDSKPVSITHHGRFQQIISI